MMTRRHMLTLAAAAAIAPRGLAQPTSGVRRIGYLSGGAGAELLAGPLAYLGWVQGRNYAFDVRVVGEPSDEALKAAASALAASRPDVLLGYTTRRIKALADATRAIPIVSGMCEDPVGSGFAKSLREPGGNVTGLSLALEDQARLIMRTSRKVRPKFARFVVLVDDVARRQHRGAQIVEAAAKAEGVRRESMAVRTDAQIDKLAATLDAERDILVMPFPLPTPISGASVAAIARRRRVAMLGYANDGGLMDVGMEHADADRRIAAILDKILRGESPAGIPFELPDRTVLTLNQETARLIGVTFPSDLLLQATRVIG